MRERANAGRESMLLALLVAAALHGILVFGVVFEARKTRQATHQVEVTLTRIPSQPPLRATHIAQADQTGSGDIASQNQIHRAAQDAPGQRQPLQGAEQEAGARAGSNIPVTAPGNELRLPPAKQDPLTGDPGRRLEALEKRLAKLEAATRQSQSASSTAPRVRTITAVSARSSVDAAYLQAWRERLETVGNTYYPQASLRYGLYGSLRMRVVIRSDGALETVTILQSSGYDVLDQAAMRIVRLAAPFAPFPPELLSTADKLEIIRNWEFEPVGEG